MTQGRFITLEGGEGAGKTTLAKALAAGLQARGFETLITREPGGTPNAEALRHLLVEGETGRWSPLAETLLLYAARADHDQTGPGFWKMGHLRPVFGLNTRLPRRSRRTRR